MKLDVLKHLKWHHEKLLSQPAKRIELTLSWKLEFEEKPGIYAVFRKNKMVYIGETGNLQGRMNDMRNTKSHTIRRSIGHEKYAGHQYFAKATSKQSFHLEIEKVLVKYMCKTLTVRVLPCAFGRKEVEEYIFKKEKCIYNKKGARACD